MRLWRFSLRELFRMFRLFAQSGKDLSQLDLGYSDRRLLECFRQIPRTIKNPATAIILVHSIEQAHQNVSVL